MLGASRKYLQYHWRKVHDHHITHIQLYYFSLPSIWYGVVLGRLRDHRGNIVSMKVSGQTPSRAASEDDLISFIQTLGHKRIKDGL